jgi:hypothetical protein
MENDDRQGTGIPETELPRNEVAESSVPDRAPAAAPPAYPAGWSVPQPEVLPSPTYAPAGIAFGVTFLLWGILTSYVVSIVGFVIFAPSLFLWIREMLHERR